MSSPSPRLTLRMLTGGRAGDVVVPTSNLVIGRDPSADLRLDPDGDLHASSRHAEICRDEHRWILHDLGSSNGTWLNGKAIEAPIPLRNGDRIQFGVAGPEAIVALEGLHPRRRLVGIGIVSVGAVALGSWGLQQRPGPSGAAGSVTLASVESVESVDGVEAPEVGGGGEEAGTGGVREADGATADGDTGEAGETGGMVEAGGMVETVTAGGAIAAGRPRGTSARAVSIDEPEALASIESDNRAAVTVVYAEAPSGEVATGTGFSVDPSGIIVSNLHVVSFDGRAASRLGVQFTDSDQVWPARVIESEAESDLVLLQIDSLVGSVPAVRGLDPSGRQSNRVVMLGFPHTSMDPGGWSGGAVPSPLRSSGTVIDRSAGELEIAGEGTPGVSGSPVFDERGLVVGVVFGGRPDRVPATVLATSAGPLARLLARRR